MATGEWGGLADNNVYRINIHWQTDLQRCQSGFSLRDTGLQQYNASEVATEVAEFVNEQFKTLLATTSRILSVEALRPDNGEFGQVEFANLLGTAVGAVGLPSFMAATVSFRSSMRKRYANGRAFWPVPLTSHVTGSELNATGLAPLQAVATDMTARYGGLAAVTNLKQVHFHEAKIAHGSRPALPRTWYDIESIRVSTIATSMDSRKVGNGA